MWRLACVTTAPVDATGIKHSAGASHADGKKEVRAGQHVAGARANRHRPREAAFRLAYLPVEAVRGTLATGPMTQVPFRFRR